MAINFPDSPSNGTQHTASGITWTYDGTTWKSEGVTSSYSLPTASSTVLGGVKVGTNLSINGSGVLSADASAITVQEEGSSLSTAATTLNFVGTGVTATGTGATKTITIPGATSGVTVQEEGTSLATAGTVLNFVGANVTATGTGATKTITITGGTGLDARSTFTATTASLADNAAGNIEVTAHKSYSLLKISPSIAAWVTLYVDAASRTADANRVQGADPAPDAGVIAEVVTTGANQVIKMSPGVLGWHQDAGGDAVTSVFCKVVNRSGSTGTCTVSLTVVQLEA